MILQIPEEILRASRLSERELKIGFAVMLFEKEKPTPGPGEPCAAMDRLGFQHLLASRQIPVHCDVADFEQDFGISGELG